MNKTRDFCATCTYPQFRKMIREAESNAAAALSLMKDPTGFFRDRGFHFPPTARVFVAPSKEVLGMIRSGTWLDATAAPVANARPDGGFEGHVSSGPGECTKVTISG